MRKVIVFIFFFSYMFSQEFHFSQIKMDASFCLLLDNKKSQSLEFTYDLALYHDKQKDFKENIYCFYDKEYIYVSSKTKKPKFKMCIKKNGQKNIYVMDKSFRYTPLDKFNIEINEIKVSVKNKKAQLKCTSIANTYATINKSLKQCLK